MADVIFRPSLFSIRAFNKIILNEMENCLDKDMGECRPVFFMGMNGSGTTMLVDCMGRHPDLYAYPYETKTIPFVYDAASRFGDLEKDENFLKLWKFIGKSCTFDIANHGQALPVPPNWKEFPRNFAAVLDASFRYFAIQEGKIRWCEKTPQYIQHIPLLHDLFPQAKFVHVIRDGRDSAASINRRFRRTPEYSIFRWKNVVLEGRRAAKCLPDKYLEVRYEDVTTDPEYWMRRICDFIDLPFSENVLLSRKPQSKDPGKRGEVKGKLEPNSGKWKSYFSDKQLQRLEQIAGVCLNEFKYTTQFESGDKIPSNAKLIYWKWKDYVNEMIGLIGREWKRKDKIRWSKLFHQIELALKQSRTNKY